MLNYSPKQELWKAEQNLTHTRIFLKRSLHTGKDQNVAWNAYLAREAEAGLVKARVTPKYRPLDEGLE